jgi:RNA polymerase sigma factor (sigma-70 family)
VHFKTTNWSMILEATVGQSSAARAALAALCQAYWPPVYALIRCRGLPAADAEDLTQAYFARFLEKGYLHDFRPEVGRFRTFLRASVSHFLANEWDRERALKRGGGQRLISLDARETVEGHLREPADTTTPETIFEREWAASLLRTCLERLQREQNGGDGPDRRLPGSRRAPFRGHRVRTGPRTATPRDESPVEMPRVVEHLQLVPVQPISAVREDVRDRDSGCDGDEREEVGAWRRPATGGAHYMGLKPILGRNMQRHRRPIDWASLAAQRPGRSALRHTRSRIEARVSSPPRKKPDRQARLQRARDRTSTAAVRAPPCASPDAAAWSGQATPLGALGRDPARASSGPDGPTETRSSAGHLAGAAHT